MKPGRLAMFVSAAAILAAWLAAAAGMGGTSSGSSAPAPVAAPRPSDPLAQEIARQADRLQTRLDAAPTPNPSGRNPFRFSAPLRPDRPPATEASPFGEPAVSPQPAAPPYALAGIAETATPDGPVRTAIISGDHDLFLLKLGDALPDGRRVSAIGPEVVELTSTDGTTVRLALP